MFLCEKCHDPSCTFHFSGSHGACEGCGKIADCVDCRNMRPAPRKKRKKRAQKPREPRAKRLTLKEQRTGLVKALVMARRAMHDYAPLFWAEKLQAIDKALAAAGASARYSDKELAGLPCRDPGGGGCVGGDCETCAARRRLYGSPRARAS